MPPLAAGVGLDLVQLLPKQHFTEPPPRYTEATLVKGLEERGIGRPSTYAPTLATIQDRGYVELNGKTLRPTPLGQQVNDFLVAHFHDVVDLAFTAELEARLDEIARGVRAWVPVVSGYYGPLAAHLRDAAPRTAPALGRGAEPCDEVCSLGHAMVIRDGPTGRFFACSRYPDHRETRPLPAQALGVSCPTCGADVVEKHTRTGSVFFGCGTWPACTWTSAYRPLTEACPTCGGVQVDLGDGIRHCLKHQGPPPRRPVPPGKPTRTATPPAVVPDRRGARGVSVRARARSTPGKTAPERPADSRRRAPTPRKPAS